MLKIGYARTSTDDQSIERQIMQLKDSGIQGQYIFSDSGTSGNKEPSMRQSYKQMLKLIATGEVSELWVTDLSRLGRDAKGTLQEIWRLQDLKIKLISLDTTDAIVLNAQPELQPLLTSAVTLGAMLQRKKGIEDTKAGLAKAALKGNFPGRPKIKFNAEKIKAMMEKGLSERSAVLACGYYLPTYYRRKKQNKVI
jgi:DNA invertase Pin-like site-specific DNA recombinase